MNKPTVLITAGGINSRFFPLNTQTHKGFLSLAGKSLFQRALESLAVQGFKKVIVVVSQKDYSNEHQQEFFKNNRLGLEIKVVLQSEAKGMGNAVLQAEEFLDSDFIIASPYYTNLADICVSLQEKKQESGADCVFSATKTDTPELYGIVAFDPANRQRVIGIVEKPIASMAPSQFKIDSVYLFDPAFIQTLLQTPESDHSLENAITTHCQTNTVTWIENKQETPSLKYAWHLFDFFKSIMSTQKTIIDSSAQIAQTAIIDDSNGAVIIQKNARVNDFAKIVGPCFIGENCMVGEYSFIRSSSIEAHTVIGANTEVVRSIVFENTNIHQSYIADSIIGQHNKIAAGLITANKRFDRQEINTYIVDKKAQTHLPSLGIITGENVQIGIGVKTMPGVLIGAQSVVYPNVLLKKNAAPNSVIEK